MATYNNAYSYITCSTTITEKIAKIEAIISALEDISLIAAGKAHIDEYELDDGQTKIKASYRSPKSIADAIDAFTKIKERWVNKCIGSVVVLRDAGSNNIYNR